MDGQRTTLSRRTFVLVRSQHLRCETHSTWVATTSLLAGLVGAPVSHEVLPLRGVLLQARDLVNIGVRRVPNVAVRDARALQYKDRCLRQKTKLMSTPIAQFLKQRLLLPAATFCYRPSARAKPHCATTPCYKCLLVYRATSGVTSDSKRAHKRAGHQLPSSGCGGAARGGSSPHAPPTSRALHVQLARAACLCRPAHSALVCSPPSPRASLTHSPPCSK